MTGNSHKRDTETIQKSHALIFIIAVHLVLLQPFIVLHMMIYGLCSYIVFPFLMTILYLIFLFNLRKGNYEVSAHGMIITFMGIVWFSCYSSILRNDSIRIVLTHLLFIIASFGLLGLNLFRRKYTVPIYVASNIALLFPALFLFVRSQQLNDKETASLLIYTTTAFLYAGVITMLDFRAGRRMLDRYSMALEQIEKSETRLNRLYNYTLTGIITIETATGRILSANERAVLMLDFETEEDMKAVTSMNSIFADPETYEEMALSLQDKSDLHIIETDLAKKDGGLFKAELAFQPRNRSDRFDICFIDITERKKAEQNLHLLQYFDQLTSIPNRISFIQKVNAEIEKSARKNRKNLSAIVCLGLDDFRKINDVYGVTAGDEVLKEIAYRLSSIIRDDDFVSRLRGDMFLMFFNELGNHDEINRIVEKIMAATVLPITLESNLIETTVTMGLCFFPDDGRTAEELIRKSESALYIAKARGRNTYHIHDSALSESIISNFRLEKDLRQAIREDEFLSYYQCKHYDADTVAGMEVLIRWNSPERGLVPPGSFIPLAEKNGMIREIGKIIMKKACSQVKEWHDTGNFTGTVSVNISPIEFQDPCLIEGIENILKETGLSPQLLELEITESSLMTDENTCIETLRKLHDMGIAIAIDDFGTGYSSLNKLRDLPIDTLKIDKSFVEKLPDDERSCTITRAIIDLAHNLGFRIVAEGVETTEQYRFLLELGCDCFQGYLFSRPVPPHECENHLNSLSSPIEH